MIREPNHGERYLPVLFIVSMVIYLLIFWFIGEERNAEERARIEAQLWERQKDSIRLAGQLTMSINPSNDPIPAPENSAAIPDKKVISMQSTPPAKDNPAVIPDNKVISSPDFTATQNNPAGIADNKVLPSADEGKTFHIIAGSFSNVKNADLAAEKYNRLGYQTSVVNRTNPGGDISRLVSIKSFTNHDEAVRYKTDLQNKSDLQTWIYSK